MKKLMLFIVSVLFVMATLFLMNSWAAESEEASGYSYGTVQNVSQVQIVVTEYDYDKDEEADVAYTINQNTAFQNVASLTDVVVGDNVDIVYVTENGARIAQSIAVEKMMLEDESATEALETQPSDNFGAATAVPESAQPSLSGNQIL